MDMEKLFKEQIDEAVQAHMKEVCCTCIPIVTVMPLPVTVVVEDGAYGLGAIQVTHEDHCASLRTN